MVRCLSNLRDKFTFAAYQDYGNIAKVINVPCRLAKIHAIFSKIKGKMSALQFIHSSEYFTSEITGRIRMNFRIAHFIANVVVRPRHSSGG
jgi:hypothetical protein